MQRVIVPDEIDPQSPPVASLVRDYAGESMGTTWSVRVVDSRQADPPDWQAGIQQQLDQVVAEMSHWQSDSDLGRFNRAPAGSWHVLPPAFAKVLTYALEVAEQSFGAYDPSAGALVNLWGFGPTGRHDHPDFSFPDAQQIADAMSVCGWQRLHFDRSASRIFQPGGIQLDFSAVAKGFAVDHVARYLEGQGLRHYLVEVGGELRGAGMKRDGQPWWVGLEAPEDMQSGSTVAALHGLAIASSGDYRRCFEYAGQRYAHTVDPRTGYPLSNQIASVSVLHAHCMAADALSTALMVMGLEEGMAWADDRGIAARFLVRAEAGYTEHVSRRLNEMMQ